ncbi:ABC transporter substrate-binding protein [Neorhizobium sp. DT-125]|uniref:ABC transporter substrate-binding protein n=1 Tax=Neorhizobium sp. DT-125 TaxID=3396163 RepID=UPI003F1CA683
MLRRIYNVIAACSCILMGSSANAEIIKLNVFTQGGPGPYRAIAEAFERENPDILVDIGTPIQTYEEILQRTLRGVIVGDAPDVAFQGYNLMRQAAQAGALINVDSFASDPQLIAQGYDQSLSSLCAVDGKLMGLPFAISVPILYFNADLIKQAGGDAARFPDNWDGIIALAERVKTLKPSLQGIHFRYNHSGNWSFQALITSAGGRIMSADDKTVEFNGPGLGALENFQSFVERGGMIDMTPDQARQAFQAGTIGIMSDSSASFNAVSKGVQGKFTLATAAYPLAQGVGKIPPGGNCATISTKDPKRQKAAWRFVRYVVGQQAQTILAQQSGYIPVNRIAEKVIKDGAKDPVVKANTELTANQLKHLTQWYGFPPPNSGKITNSIQSHIQSVVANKVSPADALRSMIADVEALLPQKAH